MLLSGQLDFAVCPLDAWVAEPGLVLGTRALDSYDPLTSLDKDGFKLVIDSIEEGLGIS
jgi:hypothetical protein